MPVNTKAIKGRIKSVGSTKKITKAMEMIAAAKMRKAVNAALDTRTYATLAWDLLVSLSKTQKTQLPLLAVRPVQKILVIIVTSNRGLCGSFNSNIIKKVSAQLKNPAHIAKQIVGDKELPGSENITIDVVGIGKKGADFAKKMNYNLVAAFTNMTDTPSVDDALPIAKMAIDAYESKSYDKVIVAYTDFRSAIFQLAKLRQVLPISEADLEKMITGKEDLEKQESKQKNLQEDTYLFEPNRLDVLQTILPRLVETQIYQAMLESAASEHSARMMAMRSASDAAEDMIKELNLNFNKARQAGITQEIAEIAGGAAALE
ncbi:MAG: ATP synthase gamma chain [Parcubacteria group bacterium Gr01-1014_13]|nr:MAG: ATP synthase gamma chain [Parcubacteria group bacterium Gr01-1014_13]